MDADRVELLLVALGTVVALWLLLKYEIKESEGRNGKAHDDIRNLIKESEGRNRELIKESEGRNEKAHGELGTRIDNGFNGLNATLMAMSNKMGFIRGWQERDERARPRPGERDQQPPEDDPTR